jgi:hypothetical protein
MDSRGWASSITSRRVRRVSSLNSCDGWQPASISNERVPTFGMTPLGGADQLTHAAKIAKQRELSLAGHRTRRSGSARPTRPTRPAPRPVHHCSRRRHVSVWPAWTRACATHPRSGRAHRAGLCPESAVRKVERAASTSRQALRDFPHPHPQAASLGDRRVRVIITVGMISCRGSLVTVDLFPRRPALETRVDRSLCLSTHTVHAGMNQSHLTRHSRSYRPKPLRYPGQPRTPRIARILHLVEPLASACMRPPRRTRARAS